MARGSWPLAAVARDAQVATTNRETRLALSKWSGCMNYNWWLFDTGLHIHYLSWDCGPGNPLAIWHLALQTRLSHRRSYPCTGLVRLPLQVREVDSGIFVSRGQLLLLFWKYCGDGQNVASEYENISRELGCRNVHWVAG